jgi:hypothetical protein
MSRRYSETIKYQTVLTLKIPLQEGVEEASHDEDEFNSLCFSNKYGVVYAQYGGEILVINYSKIGCLLYQDSEVELEDEYVLSRLKLDGPFIGIHLSEDEKSLIVVLKDLVYAFDVGTFQNNVRQ